MKIIQVVGWSQSGKTTFIKKLIPELEKKGRVAVIKHMGKHDFRLEPTKDTTLFYEAGATISVGIDGHKTVATQRTTSLDEVLVLLSCAGIDYTIIEGFKTRAFPKIVIGDLTVDNCVASDPTVDEVLSLLPRFEDFAPDGTYEETGNKRGRPHDKR